MDGRHLWENHGKSTVDGGFSVAMFDDGSLNDVQLVRHAFIVVDDVYSLVKQKPSVEKQEMTLCRI